MLVEKQIENYCDETARCQFFPWSSSGVRSLIDREDLRSYLHAAGADSETLYAE